MLPRKVTSVDCNSQNPPTSGLLVLAAGDSGSGAKQKGAVLSFVVAPKRGENMDLGPSSCPAHVNKDCLSLLAEAAKTPLLATATFLRILALLGLYLLGQNHQE